MKRYYKLMALVLCVIILFSFVGCTPEETTENVNNTGDIDLAKYNNIKIIESDIAKSYEDLDNKDNGFVLMVYDPFGNIDQKTIKDCGLAYEISEILNNATPTGEITDKISDEKFSVNANLPSEYVGTFWIVYSSKIYRISRYIEHVYIVDTYFGEGYEIEVPDEFETLIRDAWYYYPDDYYSGTYVTETNELTISHVFKGISKVQIKVKDIYIDTKDQTKNKILLEVFSSEDISTFVDIQTYISGDSLGIRDGMNLELKNGVPQLIELSFGTSYNHSYWIEIGNYDITLKIYIK